MRSLAASRLCPQIAFARHVPARCQSPTAAAHPPGMRVPPWTGAQREVEALQAVMRRFEGCPYGRPTEEEVQWFLRDRDFEPVETYEKLFKTLKWRASFNLEKVTFARVAREDATGKAYLHNHTDKFGRPALVIRVARHVIGQFTEEESQELCVFYIEKAIAARPPGVDTVLGIFDLRNFGLGNADFAFVKFLIQAFFFYYPKRAGQVLMVDAPWAFMPPYNMVKPLLGKYADLIRFVSVSEVRQYFSAETMPSDFR